MSAGGAPTEPAPIEPVVTNIVPDASSAGMADKTEGAEPTQGDRLNSLLADYGKSDSRWDLNGDGTVNVRDMLQLIGSMARRPVMAPEMPGVGGPRGNESEPPARRSARIAYRNAAAESMARSILPHMRNTEPGEIRNAVRESNLPAPQKSHVLDRLSRWHPRGHRVSVVG
jgi:hypothetical protein